MGSVFIRSAPQNGNDLYISHDKADNEVKVIPLDKDNCISSLPMMIHDNSELTTLETKTVVFSTGNDRRVFSYQRVTKFDEIYDEIFYRQPHLLFSAMSNELTPALFAVAFQKRKLVGCVISEKPTYVFGITDFTTVASTIISFLKKTFDKYNNIKMLKGSIMDPVEISQLCKRHAYSIAHMHIGMLFAKQEQKFSQDILFNKYDQITEGCKEFMKLMSIPDHYLSETVYNDTYEKCKITWYSGFYMSKEEVRQYIGNVHCVIIFRDTKVSNYKPFETSCVDYFGALNMIFLIVEKHGSFYRISTFHKGMKPFEPIIPDGYLFHKEHIRDYILIKIYNGLVAIKEDSKMSVMHTKPKTHAIYDIIQKYS